MQLVRPQSCPSHPDSNVAVLDVVEQFATYKDYLDSQVTETDMYFLEVSTRRRIG
jgi:hypothetical protein